MAYFLSPDDDMSYPPFIKDMRRSCKGWLHYVFVNIYFALLMKTKALEVK